MTPSFIPGEPLDDPDSYPFAVAVGDRVFWRGLGGNRYFYWPLAQAEMLADVFAANPELSELVEPLRAAIRQANSYHETEAAA